LILNSKTYQLSSVAQADHPDAAKLFAVYPIRRLDAEVLIDAINDITGTSELYTSAIPEPFTYLPKGQPAVAIADGSITSPFLALFGRSARATGMSNERDNPMFASQWRHLLNSSHIQQKIEQGPGLEKLLIANRPPREILDDLYLTILSRYPTDEEVKTAMAYGEFSEKSTPLKVTREDLAKMNAQEKKAAVKKAQADKINKNANSGKGGMAAERSKWTDIAWSLLNSPEFLYKH